eukprot:CAMPEP_0173186108 /NCGR_PEP_ID=MMETSP1141-20130122/9947_1 /TAXON_ID=483371 /ORGANISM="non described non described, Strain CCMP2298" /LENGTH=129 /DNA_ID=CAMNT_0014109751 /DNA_START=198 /DNA_END=586 /DNA_ORIENTATION=-
MTDCHVPILSLPWCTGIAADEPSSMFSRCACAFTGSCARQASLPPGQSGGPDRKMQVVVEIGVCRRRQLPQVLTHIVHQSPLHLVDRDSSRRVPGQHRHLPLCHAGGVHDALDERCDVSEVDALQGGHA